MSQFLRKPRLLIVGHARHGKDTAAELLRRDHGYSFASSSYFLAETVVRPRLAERGIVYPSLDACYDDRVNHRALWREIIAAHNGEDPTRLARAVLEVADIYVGMRTEREYLAARHLFDAVVWVDASRRGLPPEGADSMEIAFNLSMHLIDNNGDLGMLEREVDNFACRMSQQRGPDMTGPSRPIPCGSGQILPFGLAVRDYLTNESANNGK